jgi:hypothetical protein
VSFESTRQIRVLQLLPGTRQDDIKCLLTHYDLDDAPQYEAVSYCWGDATDVTPVQVNDFTMHVTRNLRSALFHLRLEDKSRLIWADAICINQQDLDERASQVSIMNYIYQNAFRTLIWLGPGDKSTLRAFSQLNVLASQFEAEASESSKGDSTVVIGHGFDRNDTAIEKLVGFDWWTRVWVVQELVLAPDAIVVCGKHTLQWHTFSSVIDAGLKRGIWEQRVLGFIRDNTFKQFISMYNIYLIFITGSFGNEVGAERLLHLLVALRDRNASDPRDKIFSALGMVDDPKNKIGIVPDYQSSVEVVYTRAATSFLTTSNNLDILGICSTNKLEESTFELPSWVPDWSMTQYVAEPFFMSQGVFNYKASGDSKSSPRFQDMSTLVLSGHVFDTISVLGEVFREIDDSGWENEELPPDSTAIEDFVSAGKDISKAYSLLVDIAPHLATFLAWEKVANVDDRSTTAPTGKSHMEVYWRTLCADQMPEGYDKTKSQFQEWYESLAPIRRLTRWKVDYMPGIFKPLGFLGYLRSTWKQYPAFAFLMSHLTLRRMARTESGYLCLVPASTQPGDQVWLLRGGKVPLVVRPRQDCKGNVREFVGEAFVHGIMGGERFDDGACSDICFK